MEEIELIQTCMACPEQYDAFFEGEEVGYLRLRHGYFRSEYRGKTVYESQTNGDGMFDEDEREYHLNKAKESIYNEMIKDQSL